MSNATKCPAAQRPALLSFMKDFPGCQVRDVVLSRKNGLASRFEGQDRRFPQLRTTRNNHLALVVDELGNAFVLTRKGTRKQLLAGEF